MEARLPNNLEDAKTYIYKKMDLSCVKDRMINKEKWLEHDATKAIQMYRNFLFLGKKYGDENFTIVPTIDIDEIWHNHILCTKSYTEDMHNIFGKYFHHIPDEEAKQMSVVYDAAHMFNTTAKYYAEEFGEAYENIRFRPTIVLIIKTYLRIAKGITKLTESINMMRAS
jgi:hypothetical protein